MAPVLPASDLPLASREIAPKLPRMELVRRCADHLRSVDERMQQRFARERERCIRMLVGERAQQVSDLIRLAWAACFAGGRQPALVAVGGFGRAELHPRSDIDLLLLVAADREPDSNAVERFISLCWDIGLPVSHSVRDAAETLRQCRGDVVTATSLMESRLLAGAEPLYADFRQRFFRELDRYWPPERYFKAKMAEQERRHAGFDDTAYRLEPNLKEGPGGLRDIQNIAWVCQRSFGTSDLAELERRGFLSASECEQLLAGRDYLWCIRWANHQLAGRAEERLLFAHQKRLAMTLLDTADEHSPNALVERFMQVYYRAVTGLEQLNERLLQQLRESFADDARRSVYVLNDDFQVVNGYLEVRHENVFRDRPVALMELFCQLQDHPRVAGVRATTIRLLQEALRECGDGLFRSDAALQLFWRILNHPRGVYAQLARMARYGVLGRLLPEFERVGGLMQFDLFHVYTVDQHTLFVVRNLRRFGQPGSDPEFLHAHEVFGQIMRPALLYLAGLFHDIAKGRGGDHSELGAGLARQFCQRLRLPAEDADLVAWLVRHHLLMSHVAQHSDVGDPEVIQQFAEQAGSKRRLDYLYVLTVADIAATNPKLWNSWKDSLLWSLYEATSFALQRGLKRPVPRSVVIRETRGRLYSTLIGAGLPAASVGRWIRRIPRHCFLRLDEFELRWIADCMLSARPHEQPLVRLMTLAEEGVTALLVIGPDYDGFFAAVMSVLDRMRLNIFHARIFNTLDEQPLAVDMFQLVGADGLPLRDEDCRRLRHKLETMLAGRRVPEQIDYAVPRRLREFITDAEIVFTTRAAHRGGAAGPFEMHLRDQLTVMEVRCTDRPGLLSMIAITLFRQNIRLHDARIATYGEQVRDVFLLSDYDDRPLDDAARERLREQLSFRLGASLTGGGKEDSA